MSAKPISVVCIGAGPACLTAAYELVKHNVKVTVLERDPTYVGGISKTVRYKGFSFDIGGHRFFSKSDVIEALWREILPDDFIEVKRKSRIYYNNKLFDYPLKAFDALFKLGVLQATLCVLSYLRYRVAPIPNPRNFQDWVTNQFGARLFRIFFKTYTEKVWGMKCDEISADWAAQRIKGLSLASAIFNALKPQRRKPGGKIIKTLIDHFRYPRLGPGLMWETAAEKIRAHGGDVRLGLDVTQLAYDKATQSWTVTATDAAGKIQRFQADHVVSSAALRDLIAALTPPPPPAVLKAAQSLRYRDFLVVALILKDRALFDDNWIYIHDPSVKVGRIQNFKSWSPQLVPDASLNCYGLEYFCFEGDELWNAPDDQLIALARKELLQLGLARAEDIQEGCVVRQPKAYPVYDDSYQTHVATIREEQERTYPGLHFVGRNGMHKYNNQDHAMMTGLLTARNIATGVEAFDVWCVNQDAEYHEEGGAEGGRCVPEKLKNAP